MAAEKPRLNLAPSALQQSAASGSVSEIRGRIKAGDIPDELAPSGFTALFVACQYGHPQAVAALLEAGASADLELASGVTPLLICCANGQSNCATTLVRASTAQMLCRMSRVR